MYSWAISGSSVFCDWLFLVFSGVSRETAASFFLFLKVAIILKKNSVSSDDWIELFIQLINSDDILVLWEKKGFNKCKQSMILIKGTVPEGYNLYEKYLYFRFSYLYFFLAGKVIAYTPKQGTSRE